MVGSRKKSFPTILKGKNKQSTSPFFPFHITKEFSLQVCFLSPSLLILILISNLILILILNLNLNLILILNLIFLFIFFLSFSFQSGLHFLFFSSSPSFFFGASCALHLFQTPPSCFLRTLIVNALQVLSGDRCVPVFIFAVVIFKKKKPTCTTPSLSSSHLSSTPFDSLLLVNSSRVRELCWHGRTGPSCPQVQMQ